MKIFLYFSTVTIYLFLVVWTASAEQLCIYVDKKGVIQSASSRGLVPPTYREKSICQDVNESLADPKDISLQGNIRRTEFSSSMGMVDLRWTRSTERLFGKAPNRAVIEAIRTVSKALNKAGVAPYRLMPKQTTAWQIVFMDADMSSDQIPTYLMTNCHPGWMTPPSNIYLVSERVAEGCSGAKVTKDDADVALTRVLLHEMGHVIEYHLLNGQLMNDREQSEGFAAWFEQYASDFSQIVPNGSTQKNYLGAASRARNHGYSGKPFRGSYEDYAIASTLFHAIVRKYGITRLVDVYDYIAAHHVSLRDAVTAELHMSERMLEAAAAKITN